MDMKSKITLPPPPLCAPHPGNFVNVNESVTIELISGADLTGTLLDFQMTKGYLIVSPADAPDPRQVPLLEIKKMILTTQRQWVSPSEPVSEDQDPDSPTARQPFNIKFKDGQTFSGETLGFRTDRNGIYLFPVNQEDFYTYAFVSHDAVAEHQVGPRLGEILVEGNLVEQEQVDAALEYQAKQRNRPVGDYLENAAIVTTEDLEQALDRQKAQPNKRIGEILIEENLITEDQLVAALEQQKKDRHVPLGQLLIDEGLVTTHDIQQALAKKLGIPYVNLEKFSIDGNAVKMVPEDLIRKHKVVPLHLYKGKIILAVENPINWEPLDAVRFHTNLYVEPVMASAENIEAAINKLFSQADLADLELDDYDSASLPEEEVSGDDDGVADNVVVRLVNKIIIGAHQQEASDIHIEPHNAEGKTQVRIRKDGTLLNFLEVPAKMRNAIVARIKIMAGLDISEKRKPQDGKIDFKKFSRLKIELRVATLPTVGGQEDVVMRILAGGKPIPVEDLGLSDHNRDRLMSVIEKPYGLFCVCGPTGSGKTTSLHSILGQLNTADRKIWTAEDPVEITQKGLRQVQVNAKIGLTFAAAMRSFLRADPDIIMVGEMRDQETAKTGIEASLTGHMVFATLHTNSAPESIVRLLDMGMDPFNFADALLGILAQRLTKRLCPDCKEAYQPNDVEMKELLTEYCHEVHERKIEEKLSFTTEDILEDWMNRFSGEDGKLTLYRAKGCSRCDDSGYRGRIGLHELLLASDRIKKHVLDSDQVSDVLATALSEGMRTLKQDGIEKVLAGHTDVHQVRRVCIK